jgi:putative oxidoreductase
MFGNAATQTRLIVPGLRGFYDSFTDIAYTLLRVVIGYNLLMHGWVKVTSQAGAAGVAGYMTKLGLEPGTAFAYAAIFLETVGAVCLIIGLFTRFFAAALAIEMAIAFALVHLPKGFTISNNNGGYEYVLLIGIVLLLVAIRGGGPYSVDRLIGREL